MFTGITACGWLAGATAAGAYEGRWPPLPVVVSIDTPPVLPGLHVALSGKTA